MTPAPILILQHEAARPPGYLADFLAHRGRATFRILLRGAHDLPQADLVAASAGVVVLDAAAGVLDPPPWHEALLEWLVARRAAGTPLLGHGYGAHLITLASGGEVQPVAPARGWFPVEVTGHWPLQSEDKRVLMWHDACLRPPPGWDTLVRDRAGRALACSDGRALVTQFLPQVAPSLYDEWLAAWRATDDAPSASLQTVAELEHARQSLPRTQRLARALYEGWLERCIPPER